MCNGTLRLSKQCATKLLAPKSSNETGFTFIQVCSNERGACTMTSARQPFSRGEIGSL